jgi:hypothetical protein
MKIRQVVTTKYGEIKYRQLTCFCNQNKYAACLCHNPSSFVFTENNPLIDVDNLGEDNQSTSNVCSKQTSATSSMSIPGEYHLLQSAAEIPGVGTPETGERTSIQEDITVPPSPGVECSSGSLDGQAICNTSDVEPSMMNRNRENFLLEQPTIILQENTLQAFVGSGGVAVAPVAPTLESRREIQPGVHDDSNQPSVNSSEIPATSFYGELLQ